MFAPGFRLADYAPRFADELVRMWRASFEHGVGVVDENPLEAQLAYLDNTVLPAHRVRVVVDESTGAVAGFLAANEDSIAALYIHVDYLRRGLGSRLLELAKAESNGVLRLFTFDANQGAQRFYEHHGFRIIGRGFEEQWQLADIEYEWRV
ncbi:MAG: GNAT family N-acetyltransferase [Planctomycetota bacterium]